MAGATKEPALILSIRRAAGSSDSKLVHALIKAGANVNTSDYQGTPALIVAVRECGNVEVVRLLLEAGSDVNKKDQDGDTALIAAVREYLPSDNEAVRNALRRNPRVIRTLLAAGSDITIKGKDGDTAFDVAKRANNKDIIQLLSEAEKKRR